MNTVAIVGVGLIGGSFGLALRKAGFAGEILGVSSQAALEAGKRVGAISRSATLQEVAEADLIYLSQTVDGILKTLETVGPLAASGSLITDAGSTKTAIVRKASEYVRSATFLGGHPLAGKERRGAESADADLFRDHTYVLTPAAPETPAFRTFRSWLRRIGAHIVELPASEHDAIVAFTSHLPQLAATGLAVTLAHQTNDNLKRIVGPGLLDMTRLAMSSAELWQSILATNKTDVLMALDVFLGSMHSLRAAVESEDLGSLFEQAATFAHLIRSLEHTKEQST